ncbi:MAG: M23 family metallopeptidase [Rikenellaceae bacterium]
MNRTKQRKSRKGRVAQLRARKQFWKNVVRAVIHGFTWIGAAVLYYAVISLFFDTPSEYFLKRSSQMLHDEYATLQSRYDSLEVVLNNVEERDKNIFNIMFESTPYNFESEHDERLLALFESMIDKPNIELRQELERRCAELEQKVIALNESTQTMVEKIDENSDKWSNIPAIQPVANRQLTLLTASYGLRIHPFYKTIQPHQGVDYTVAEGTRVFATADGIVKSTTLSSSTTGKSLVIDHGNGYQTLYNHLSRVDVPRGRKVSRGDIIGLSGNTGLSLAPHLHYEVRYNDMRVDPIHYMFMELTPSDYQKIIKIAQSGMQSFD